MTRCFLHPLPVKEKITLKSVKLMHLSFISSSVSADRRTQERVPHIFVLDSIFV